MNEQYEGICKKHRKIRDTGFDISVSVQEIQQSAAGTKKGRVCGSQR